MSRTESQSAERNRKITKLNLTEPTPLMWGFSVKASTTTGEPTMHKFRYLEKTWNNGREFGFPVSFIIKEMLRGFSVEYNVLTEI